MAEIDAAELARRLGSRTPAGIASQVQELIDDGTLAPGARLPTVRDLAQELGVSVGTIAQAWGLLREENAVETRRRGGTRVVDAQGAEAAGFRGFHAIDLHACSPDPALLPPLENAAAAALKHPSINAWGREYLTEDLRRACAQDLPFQPEQAIAVAGGARGLWLATAAAVSSGGTLAVESPFDPGFLETARKMGITLHAVATDEHGPLPESLQEALDAGAAAFVLAPAGPFGHQHMLTEDRAEQLRALLDSTDAVIIEDDPLGPLVESPPASLAASYPDRSLRVLDYARAFGVDIRTAVLAGPERLIARAVQLRAEGLSSHSRILQQMVAELADSTGQRRRLKSVRQRYARRREAAVRAFEAAGFPVASGPNSWSVWVQVVDEHRTTLALSSQGVVVDAGSSAYLQPAQAPSLRISIAQLPEDPERLAELTQMVGAAAAGNLRPTFV
ncbi:aminotransferase class I/II-fold pyridoxal phosphate-dependent enzyme [Nesterenkonia populi]